MFSPELPPALDAPGSGLRPPEPEKRDLISSRTTLFHILLPSLPPAVPAIFSMARLYKSFSGTGGSRRPLGRYFSVSLPCRPKKSEKRLKQVFYIAHNIMVKKQHFFAILALALVDLHEYYFQRNMFYLLHCTVEEPWLQKVAIYFYLPTSTV